MDVPGTYSFVLRVGAILSPFLAFWGVYQIINKITQKRDKKLTLFCLQCRTILTPTLSKMGVVINHLTEGIEHARVILFHAYFINKGKKDIRLEKNLPPITLQCSKSYRWLNAVCENTPRNMVCGIHVISDNDLVVEWDLLKKGESIYFVGLAEIIGKIRDEDTSKFYNSMEIISRIEDVPPIPKLIDNVDEPLVREYRRKIESIQIYFMGVLLAVIGLFLYYFGPDSSQISVDSVYEPVYSVEQVSDNSFDKMIMTASKDSVLTTIVEDDNNLAEPIKISVSDFNKHYSIRTLTSIRSPKKPYMKLFVVYSGLFLIAFTAMTDLSRFLKKQSKYNKTK